MISGLANKLTILRFFLALIVIVFLIIIPFTPNLSHKWVIYGRETMHYFNYVCLFLFLIAAFTDFMDGKIARKRNQITTFGKIFDPIADKIIINSVLIIFAAQSRIPSWVTILLVARDIFVDGLRTMLSSKGEILAAKFHGKLKTTFEFIGISILFIFFPPNVGIKFDYGNLLHLALIPIYISVILSLYSGISYYKSSWPVLFDKNKK